MLNDPTLITRENFNPHNSGTPLSPLNDVSPQKDMFERQEQLLQIQKTVDGCYQEIDSLKKAIDLNITNTKEGNPVEHCRVFTTLSFQIVKNQIENFEEINKNPGIMPMGATSKKVDAKTALISHSKRFEKLFEDLIEVEFFAKNLTSEYCMKFPLEKFSELKIDLENITNNIDVANKDFKDIETQTLKVLARLGPTKRNSETKGATHTALYKEILNLYSQIALTNHQFETHLFNLAARVELLRPGKDLIQKLENEVYLLHEFKNNSSNVESKGIFKYTYVKIEKENIFVELVKNVRENFLRYTLEAALYKVRLQDFLGEKVILLNEQYSRDLAYGEKEQIDINSNTFSEANRRAKNIQTKLLNDINEAWLKVSTAQNKLFTKLIQAEIAIQTKTIETSEMYFNSETLTAWKMDTKDLLNSNIHFKEKEFI